MQAASQRHRHLVASAWAGIVACALAFACAWLAAACSPAHAALVLSDTRLVYHGGAPQARITVLNMGRQPALMQAWIDTGNPEAPPQDIRAPFVVTPPMARIDAGQRQTLSVVFTGSALPADRESLFWLNVLDIPPRPRSAGQRNYIQFAVRTRIKLLYRPVALRGNPTQAMRLLRWREVCARGRCVVQVRNPSPYCIAIVELRCRGAHGAIGPALQGTVLPFGTRRWRLPGAAPVRSVSYAVVNDYGAFVHARAAVVS